LSHAEFLLVTGAGSVLKDLDHLRKRIGTAQQVSVTDVTGAHAVYGVMGPQSRSLLQKLSRADMTNEGFPFGTSREIDLGYATVRATRITYVGELGWELYVPAEFAVGVYESLVDAGREFGLVNAGYYAINSLRLEKGYRAFGAELTPDYNPVEAGLLFATKLKTDIPFLGRPALEKAKADGPQRRLVSFALTDPDVMMWGGELVLRNGMAVGQVTSAAWGATIGSAVGLAYLRAPDGSAGAMADADFLAAGDFEINVGGRRTPARLSLKAPYDPSSARVKC
jgi:4-methylaminobutanoate oxidase (formaldehyde-forming)